MRTLQKLFPFQDRLFDNMNKFIMQIHCLKAKKILLKSLNKVIVLLQLVLKSTRNFLLIIKEINLGVAILLIIHYVNIIKLWQYITQMVSIYNKL